jgi:hypothetical protein
MSEAAVFVSSDGRFVATELARGPWDPSAQHGGAPAALLMRAFEQMDHDSDLVLARATYEFMRPVPIAELEVDVDVIRSGRRVQLLEGTISSSDGTELVRARCLRMAAADADPTPPQTSPPPLPSTTAPEARDFPVRPMFGQDAMEVRFVTGAFFDLGPATAWFRLRVPLLAGEAVSPLQRLAAAADFGNGIASPLPWYEFAFINADLTVYVEREPVGEWICLEAQSLIATDGVGIAESVLYDERGRVGRATQALLVTPGVT